jgi:hypothetical protein
VFVTLRLVRPAKLLMFAVVKLPVVALIVAASTVPVTLRLVRPVRFVMFAFVMLAFVAVRPVTFARLVMLFCAPALKVPLKVPPVIVPVALIFVKLPVVALTVAD